jgi:hypothetical protein
MRRRDGSKEARPTRDRPLARGGGSPHRAAVVYAWFANLVLLLHASFVLFVALGGTLSLRWPRAAWLHLPALAWGAAIEFSGGICPLTPLENRFRALAGRQGYDGGFIEHYVLAWLYPDGLTRDVQFALGIGVLLVNALVYAWVLARRRRR